MLPLSIPKRRRGKGASNPVEVCARVVKSNEGIPDYARSRGSCKPYATSSGSPSQFCNQLPAVHDH